MDKAKTGELIREARKAKCYTQSELGDMLGVTNKAVSRWEKGESFPDVGVLENLAGVLDLKIQDIVVGEVQKTEEIESHSEAVMADILRITKVQIREKKKRIYTILISALTLIICIMAGLTGLLTPRTIICDSSSGGMYYLLLVLTLMLFTYGWYTQEKRESQISKIDKSLGVASVVVFCGSIIITMVIVLFVSDGITPFGMELSKTGPLLAGLLMISFMLSIVMFTTELLLWWKERCRLHYGFVFQILTVYISALYGDMLHNISSMVGFLENFTLRTIIVVACALVVMIIMKTTEKKMTGLE